jgi:three-Cys-motif partner protein
VAPHDTVWLIDSHTRGKHRVLRAYLDAWLPILGMTQGRVIFIDGFAGPGEYVGGEEGSPLIALRAFDEHPAAHRIRAEVCFLFIEKDPARADHLRQLITARPHREGRRQRVQVKTGVFDGTMNRVLDELDAAANRMAPAFVMIDPFGVAGTPMDVVQRIMGHPKSEVFVSFMFEWINRFLSTEEYGPHLDALFGSPDWRQAKAIPDSIDRRNFLFDLYERQLRSAGATYVLRFELYRGNELVYAIFFGTKHELGCDRMKQAIWKIIPEGDYAFRGARTDQLGFSLSGDLRPLRNELIATFGHDRWVTIGDLTEFVCSDRTFFHTGHLKRETLAPMEREGLLEVEGRPGRRRGQFPDGTRIKFLKP